MTRDNLRKNEISYTTIRQYLYPPNSNPGYAPATYVYEYTYRQHITLQHQTAYQWWSSRLVLQSTSKRLSRCG